MSGNSAAIGEFDPFALRLAQDWLVQYARYVHVMPDVVNRLRERTGEFEMVPVPKELLSQLSSSGLAAFGTGGLRATPQAAPTEQWRQETGPESIVRREVARTKEDLAVVARNFARELEAGRVDTAMQYVSPRYFDLEGRRANDIRDLLNKVFSLTKSRRVVSLQPGDVHTSGSQLVTTFAVSWDAELVSGSYANAHSTYETIFERDDDRWLISSLRTV